MRTEPQWRDVVDLLIPHPTQRQLLVQAIGAQWFLPNVAIGRVWDAPIGRFNATLQQLF